MTQEFSIAYLQSVLDYNPTTGIFRWKSTRSGRIPASKIAGAIHSVSGHRTIVIDQRKYKAHRLAWFYVYGKWPPYEIDHINMIPDDNRIVNLRLIAKGKRWQQRANQMVRKDSNSGLKGVRAYGNKWMARCRKNGVEIHRCGFASAKEAHEAYVEMAIAAFGEFARPV